MSHPKHQQVRSLYDFRCGYCGVAEVDAAGELTVDHYHPSSAGGDDSDANLVYCCSRCNLYKGAFVPSSEDVAQGRRVLHPLLDDISLHVRRNERNCMLEPLTETGRFHITLLHLNRPALVTYRVRQRMIDLHFQKQHLLEVENQNLRGLITAQEEYIACLRRLLNLPPDEAD